MRRTYKLMLLAAIVMTALPAAAYDFMEGGIAYDINPDGTSVTVTYEKEPKESNDWRSYSNASGSLSIPSVVTYSGKTYSVTAIGSRAFHGCSGFTGSLAIPESVTSIGYNAFDGCSGFTGSLTIPESVTSIGEEAFYWCSGFTGSLTIPNSVTAISYGAFAGCSGFTGSLAIPDSVTYIGDYAFAGCWHLTGELTIGKSVITIGEGAFGTPALGSCGFTGSLTIPNSVTTIGDFAFEGCSGFTGSLNIPNSVTAIGDYAFEGCSGFTGSLTIPNSVTSIGGDAFEDCRGFTGSLTIPNSVTSIGDEAFSGCRGFTGLIWNAKNCASTGSLPTANIERLSIGNEVEIIPSGFIRNSKVSGSLTIPNSVTSIGEQAFDGCSGFTGSLTIPNSVTFIGNGAFYGCSGFTGSLTIPESVTFIGNYTFYGCSGFTGSLTIPNSVTTIGGAAFSGCSGFSSLILTGDGEFHLTSGTMPTIGTVYIQSGITGIKGLGLSPNRIYSFATTPPECDGNSFTKYSAALHVPKRALAAYVGAPYWSNFGNIAGDAVEPEALEWAQEAVSLKLGDQLTLDAPILTPDNAGLEVNVTSSNTEMVSLSRSYDYNAGTYVYTIKGLKAGEADIIATCAWLEARLHVTVTEDVITITLDKHEVELEAGTMVTLTPSAPLQLEYAVESSDPTVATARVLNGRVQVVGAKPGVAVVTVSDVEGKATPDTCRVTVIRPAGDATGDGYLDIDDVNTMINVMLGLLPTPEGDELAYSDFDGNGKVDVVDLNQLINILLAQ